MNDEIQDANLELLIGLRQHLDYAVRLRALLDRLLSLADRSPPAAWPKTQTPKEDRLEARRVE